MWFSKRRTVLVRALLASATLMLAPAWAAAEDFVAEAREYVAQGEYKSAIIQLKNALKYEPRNTEARTMLGELYLRAFDGDAALKEFARVRDLGGAPADWLLGYARALAMQQKFDRLLQEVSADESLPALLRAELYAIRGNAYLDLRKIDSAEVEYDKALELAPGLPAAGLGKARTLINRQQNEAALTRLDGLVSAHPDQAEIRLVRGDLHRRQGELDAAEADFRHAAEITPNSPRAYVGLALVHLTQRNVAAAEQDLKVLERLSPNAVIVHYLRALASTQTGDYARASDELQGVLRVAPNHLQAQLLYGVVTYARKEFTLADEYLSRVLAIAPGDPQVVKLLGAARLKLQQPKRAIEVLSTLGDGDTQDPQLLALLGTAYIQSGDNSKGAQYIERAVELDPDEALLRTQLAVGRISTGDTIGAIEELESAVALDQDVIQADVLLVLSYMKKREFGNALAAASALERRMSDSPIPYNLTGLAYLAQREFELARERFGLALQKDPNFTVARMNLARLALMAERLDDAETAYRTILEREPEYVDALMGMASLARLRDQPEDIERWLVAAHNANPKALQPILTLAESYLRRNEALKAVNLLSGLEPPQSELPPVLRLQGISQLQNGDYANAAFTLRKLTQIEPDAIEGWFQLARAEAAGGSLAAARRSFERAIELDAEHKVPVVWVGLAELELRENNYDAALQTAARIKTHFPKLPFGYDTEAVALRGKGDLAGSLAAAEQALAVDPGSARISRFARTLAEAGQVERGVGLLRDWLAEHPEDGGAWASLGIINQQRGDDAQALAAYEKALEHGGQDPVILNNLAWLYLERDGARAVELATQAYELAPNRPEIVDTYGWALYRNGRESKGLAVMQQALIMVPHSAEIALHVAEALHGMERDAEARPIVDRIMREHPDTVHAQSAQALRARLRE